MNVLQMLMYEKSLRAFHRIYASTFLLLWV